MVRLTKESNPFDGIGDGVIEGAVLTVELKVVVQGLLDVMPLQPLFDL